MNYLNKKNFKYIFLILCLNIISVILLINTFISVYIILPAYICLTLSLIFTAKYSSITTSYLHYNYLLNIYNHQYVGKTALKTNNISEIEHNIFILIFSILYLPLHLLLNILYFINKNGLQINVLIITSFFIITIVYLSINYKKLQRLKNTYIQSKNEFTNGYKTIILANKYNKESKKINKLEKEYKNIIALFWFIKTLYSVTVISLTLFFNKPTLNLIIFIIPLIITVLNIEPIIEAILLLKTYHASHIPKNNRSNITFKNNIMLKDINYKQFKNISITFPKGKITVIYGPNLSGKTTLLKILLNQISYDDGNIIVDNIPIINNSLINLANYSPQNMVIFSNSIIKLFKELNKNTNPTLIHHVLKIANAQDFTYNLNYLIINNGQNISPEQNAKLKIALNLIRSKELLIFDETLNDISFSSTKRIINNIKDLPKTVIITTTNPNLITFADHLIIMKDLKIIYEGSNKSIPKDIERKMKL